MSRVRLDRRGLVWGVIAIAMVLALSFIGSDRLVWFDAALVGYLFGIVFAVFGVVYRYAVWLRRPSTAIADRFEMTHQHKAAEWRDVCAVSEIGQRWEVAATCRVRSHKVCSAAWFAGNGAMTFDAREPHLETPP